MFEIGDEVYLKSGSDPMTVSSIDLGIVVTNWFPVVGILENGQKLYGTELLEGEFYEDQLDYCLE